jgi:hypothetical protein
MKLSFLHKLFRSAKEPLPPPDILFERGRIGVRPDRETSSEPRVGKSFLKAISSRTPAHIARRSERFEYPLEGAALNLDLGPMCFVSITGSEVANAYSFDLHSQVECDDQQQANALLERLSFTRQGNTFALKSPPSLEHVRVRTYLDVLMPPDRPVILTPAYTAVEVSGIAASVTISATHGRISLFDLTGQVDVAAHEGGSIVFVGGRGRAHLSADSIHLKLTEQYYEGIIQAMAAGAVTVQLPPAFKTGFEANVARRARFVYRGDLESQLEHRKELRRVVFAYRSKEQPLLQFASRTGTVAIDTTS